MSRLTLRLPDTLHHQLSDAAKSEGISLNQYIVYALTRQVTTAYTVRPASASGITEERAAYSTLHAPVRSHDAILNSYAPEDEGLYDDFTTHPLLALANLGECPESDVSERAEEILADEIDPGLGWSTQC
jgi:hypothetical protein